VPAPESRELGARVLAQRADAPPRIGLDRALRVAQARLDLADRPLQVLHAALDLAVGAAPAA
jgi:hypothetical protein